MILREVRERGAVGGVHRQEIAVPLWMLALQVLHNLLLFMCHNPGTGASL